MMGRSIREELIGLRHEKMAGGGKQSADEGVRSLTASIIFIWPHTHRGWWGRGALSEGQCRKVFGFIELN